MTVSMDFKFIMYIFSLYKTCYSDIHNDVLSDYEYASLPILFHMDNFDDCMLLEDKAFFCFFSYELQPSQSNQTNSKMWNNLKKIQGNTYGYRHDLLRHGICVPKACPNVTKTDDTDSRLYNDLTRCYNEKFRHLGVSGNVTQVSCYSKNPKYPVDWWDDTFLSLLQIYLTILLVASFCERVLKSNTRGSRILIPLEYCTKILEALSIPQNWNRLKVINSNPDTERLRCIQGLRFYTMMLVILTHTIYILFDSLPVSNAKAIETHTERFLAVFLTSGPLCISTFFMLSSFLLIHGIFDHFKNREIGFRSLLLIFINRYLRLTPSLAVIIAFQSTWLRHLGTGPNWNNIVNKEYLRCRKNGWTNIFYVNNINPENMCLQTTWYLALDTQYFIIVLFLIWIIRKYQRSIWLTLGTLLVISTSITFYHNYANDFPAVMIPKPELVYDMKHTLNNRQWHVQYIGFFENIPGAIIGLGLGHLYYKFKNQKIFTKNIHILTWWMITHALGYGTVIIPGVLSLSKNIPHNIVWASVMGAVSRPLFALATGVGLIGMSQGVGWIVKWILEWPPVYVLGRLTYTAYLVHIPLLLLRTGMIRSPVYFNEYSIFFEFVGTVATTYLVSTIFTLLFEMPFSQLQKLAIPQKSEGLWNHKKYK